MDSPEHDKLDDLEARIKAAEEHHGGIAKDAAGPIKASQTGYELIGTVIICVVLGWLIDRYLHTKPWGIMVMLLVGFIAGGVNVWRSLNGYDQSVGLQKKNDGTDKKDS